MAVPTISSVTPDEVTTIGGGQIIITGTNFQVPVDPMAGPGPIPWPTPDIGQGVQVRLFSVSPPWTYTFAAVAVASSTKIKLNMPSLPLPRLATGKLANSVALSVEVTNLDINEDPIPGEVVVFNSILLRRPLVSGYRANSLTKAVTGSLITHLEMICPNVTLIPDVDWDNDVVTEYIEQAPQPSLVVIGPFIVKSTEGRSGLDVIEKRPTDSTYTVTHPLSFYDYDYRILGISDSAMELQNMIGALLNSIMRFMTLTVYENPAAPDPENALTFDMSFPRPPSVETQIQALNSNLRLFKADLAVHSIPAAGVDSFLDDSVTESGAVLGTGPGDCPSGAEHISTGTGVELCVDGAID